MTGWRKRGGGGVMSDGGKGSARRNEDVSKIKSNWDQIDWSVKMNDNDELDYVEDDDTEYDCSVCGGQMVLTGHKMYYFCDTCGHREEVTDDDDYT